MKTLLIQQHESKFIQSLLHLQTESEGVKIIGSIFNERLYKLYFLNKPTHVVFIGSKLNAENLQFISEYSSIVKCYIFLLHYCSLQIKRLSCVLKKLAVLYPTKSLILE